MEQSTTETRDNGAFRGLIASWDAGWAARDANALASLFSEDATWEDGGLNGPIVGRDNIRRYVESMLRALPDIEVHQEELLGDLDDETRFGSRWVIRGTFREDFDQAGYGIKITATGDKVVFTGVALGALSNGKITQLRQYADLAAFQRQIGMLPPADSGMERMLTRLQALGARRRKRKNA